MHRDLRGVKVVVAVVVVVVVVVVVPAAWPNGWSIRLLIRRSWVQFLQGDDPPSAVSTRSTNGELLITHRGVDIGHAGAPWIRCSGASRSPIADGADARSCAQ